MKYYILISFSFLPFLLRYFLFLFHLFYWDFIFPSFFTSFILKMCSICTSLSWAPVVGVTLLMYLIEIYSFVQNSYEEIKQNSYKKEFVLTFSELIQISFLFIFRRIIYFEKKKKKIKSRFY